MSLRPLAAMAALALAACASAEDGATPDTAAAAAAALPPPTGLAAGALPAVPLAPGQPPGDVPDIYMALEGDPGRPVSVVFAIDAAGEPGPAGDPAIRLTPEGGRCNPQELTRYGFAGADARPVFGPEQAAQGVDPRRLPEFMAVSVSRRMIERGLAATPDETRPQNVCTRKLWERLVVGQARAAEASAGQ